MTPKDAIKVLNMVEAHGSLTIDAKETAIKALQLMDKFLELPIGMPKKGKWIANMRFGMYPCDEMWICSECREQSMKRSDYCPKCGADMRKEGENMARLTTEEKANRYDALQAAIEINIKTYKSRQQDAQNRYDKGTVCDRVDMIAAYNKGIADTCEDVLTMLAAFTN